MKSVSIIFLLLFVSPVIKSQQATNAAGGSNVAGNFIIDWNFGELTLVDNVSISGLLVTQGLIQPNRGLFSEPNTGISAGELKILPNPTNGMLNVWAGFLTPGKLSFEFFDAKGSRILHEEKIYSSFNSYQFRLEKYSSGSYPLKVLWKPVSGRTRKANFIIIKQ